MTVPFTLMESAVYARRDDGPASEDVIADGDDFFVLADGATDKSGIDFDGRTGGLVVAEIVCRVVAAASSGTKTSVLVERINAEYQSALAPWLARIDPVDRPSASFVALDKRIGAVVRVGDTTWRTRDCMHRGAKRIDQITADARACLIRCLLAEGRDQDELRTDDPGRGMILPLLRHQAVLRNDPSKSNDLAFGAIDGRPVPEHFVEAWTLVSDVTEVVLASDGYPSVEMTLAASERLLAEDIETDPLHIGAHRGTKAVVPGGTAFDDRAYGRLARWPA